MILKDRKYAILFLAPALVLIAVFLINPLLQTVYYSFTDWHQFGKDKNFIGLENYIRLIRDPVVYIAIKNTLMLVALCIVFEVGLALILAMLIDSIKRGFKLFRTIYFFPVVISGSAIGLMFSLAYQYDYGLLNNILNIFGGDKKVWLTENSAAILSQIPYIWQMVGFYVVIFLTAISKIPSDIYESASIDGITGIKKSLYITLPLIKDVIVTSIIVVITSATKVFDIVFTITGGGPVDSSQLLSTYMYQSAFTSNNQGYGCALAMTIVVIGVLLTVLTNLMSPKEVITY
jgi:raffinose/stachyose/melibiose transport system permease protein